MKKNILFLADGYSDWKGGLYYIKNMLYSLLMCEETAKNMKIYVLVSAENKKVFQKFADDYENVILISEKTSFFSEIRKKIRKIYWESLKGKPIMWSLSDGIMERYSIDAVFPTQKLDYYYRKKCICWVPDFQQNHYPGFFSEQELKIREQVNGDIAQMHERLVLSSNAAFDDYKKAYPDCTDGVFIVPFVSAIDKPQINDNEFKMLLQKYDIPPKYFIVSNQFWRHKNHKVLFEAMAILKEKSDTSVMLICTGQLQNSRNPEYAADLLSYIEKEQLQDYIKILGLIERNEQIELIDKSVALIQPSLFEGWGTSVEDAKTLGTRIIMSDLPVHYEQKTEDCLIFERNNAKQLAEIMNRVWNDDQYISKACYDMRQTATAYGEKLYKVLME